MFLLPAYDPTAIAIAGLGILAGAALAFGFRRLQTRERPSLAISEANRAEAIELVREQDAEHEAARRLETTRYEISGAGRSQPPSRGPKPR
jgi:hypothetical protein